jgi:hypothetical protein
MRALLLAMPILACLAASTAQACTLRPPGTPEEEARWALDAQAESMRESTVIFVAEIADIRAIDVQGSPVAGLEATLRPARALQGPLPRRALVLRQTDYTSCGMSPSWPAFYGQPGQSLIIFATAEDPGQEDVRDVVRVQDLRLPALRARLTP